jgi:hypothetical protein
MGNKDKKYKPTEEEKKAFFNGALQEIKKHSKGMNETREWRQELNALREADRKGKATWYKE